MKRIELEKLLKMATLALGLAVLAGCGGSDMYDTGTESRGYMRSCVDMEASYTNNCSNLFGGETSCSLGLANADNSVPITCTCNGAAMTSSTCGVIASIEVRTSQSLA